MGPFYHAKGKSERRFAPCENCWTDAWVNPRAGPLKSSLAKEAYQKRQVGKNSNTPLETDLFKNDRTAVRRMINDVLGMHTRQQSFTSVHGVSESVIRRYRKSYSMTSVSDGY